MPAIEMIEDVTPLELEPAPRALTVQPAANSAVSATPADLVRYALQTGADLDKLERLYALQIQWEQRESVKAFNEAFAAFKAEAVRIIKNRTVDAGPLSGKKYAELFAVVNAATPALSKHGLSASWKLTKDDKDWIEVTCTLKHALGHSESVAMGGPPDTGGAKNPIQARASTVSYLERYTLKAITGLSEQEDDDDAGHGSGEKGRDQKAGLIDAGREAAMEGSARLTEWWGKLTARQRADLNKDFGAMRKAATQADKDAGRA